MNPFNEVRDEEFVPFLNKLGVETYNKSFEWMLNDPNFSGVLLWLYNNLDQNNALTAREEYRYAEIHKKGALRSPEDLATSVSSIVEAYEGIPLPGDQDAMEDITMETDMLKERLQCLEKQEIVVQDLLRQNEIIKDELNREGTKLNGIMSQCKVDEEKAAEECLVLSQEIETITKGTIDVVADRLTLYSSSHFDKQIAKTFFVNGPLDSYAQSQSMFRSHFDLFLSKRFNHSEDLAQEVELRDAIADARELEIRLSKAIGSLFESKAQHAGARAIITLLGQYSDPHPSQYESASFEARNSMALLEQQNAILDQQIEAETRKYSHRRTETAIDAAVRHALSVRENMYAELSFLYELTLAAHALDSCVYYSLRREVRATLELLQFAAHLSQCVAEDDAAVGSRIESMHTICTEQQASLNRIKTEDPLMKILCSVLSLPADSNVNQLVKAGVDLQSDVQDLKQKVDDLFREREERLKEINVYQQPLVSYLWDGCTTQPNCHSRAVAALTHTLVRDLDDVDRTVLEASSLFSSVKNGDKQNLRKLWQWFLTDQARLHAVMKDTASKSYS